MNQEWQVPEYDLERFRLKANRFAICVFVINEGDKIRNQLQTMKPYVDLIDILVCDGGSTDGSLDDEYMKKALVTARLTKTGPGKLSAQMRMGLAWCMQEGYEGCVIMDGNGKDGVEAIPKFVRRLEEGADHVQGSRFMPGGFHAHTPVIRLIGVQCFHAPLISLAAGTRYTDTTNGFRGYSRKLLLDKRVQPFRSCFAEYELHYYLAIRSARLGFSISEIPVSRCYPAHGRTPTKIKGFRGNLKIIKTLIKTVMGKYNPVQ